ncbi:hypothetical protein JOB18_021127 [Solea senegalensis]|uniref:Secreted protein n=1 Tax=Solea senegalensis TaxID=28829 RepID=A0AAV6PK51_SOLSE|nr:hypothetical protein JOB18_021127 [Solea senegalensis]
MALVLFVSACERVTVHCVDDCVDDCGVLRLTNLTLNISSCSLVCDYSSRTGRFKGTVYFLWKRGCLSRPSQMKRSASVQRCPTLPWCPQNERT